MVKKSNKGLHDWIIQRTTALFFLGYLAALLGFWLKNYPGSVLQWQLFFSLSWVKVLTLLASGMLLWHAWVGLWTIFTDYVKCLKLRACLQTLVVILLLVYFMATACVLWGGL